MTPKYICDYEGCDVELPSEDMFYTRVPPRIDRVIRIRRFCTLKHFHSWVHAICKGREA